MVQSGKHLANAAPVGDADEPPFDLPQAAPTLPKAADITSAARAAA